MSLSRDPAKIRAWRARSKPLRRRGKGPTRDRVPIRRGKGLRSKRLSPIERAERVAVREFVARRDGHCVLAGYPYHVSCFGPSTPHHLRKASQGGGYDRVNIVALCAAGNTWVEDNPDAAHALGLVVRRGDTLDDAWDRLAAAGLVTYRPDGVPL